MPTKVLDLDFADLPASVEHLADYRHALILLRVNRLPVGKLHISLDGPRLTRQQLLEAACQQFEPAFVDGWLSDWMGYDGRPNPQPLPSATIAVCTRDRPGDLACLQSGMVAGASAHPRQLPTDA